MHLDHLRTPHCLNEAAAICAELLDGAEPAYLATPDQAGERFQCHDGCCGFTTANIDLALSPYLRRTGRWRGRGFAAIIDARRIIHWQGIVAANVIGVACHELAHHLERRPVQSAEWEAAPQHVVDEVTAACEEVDFSYCAPERPIPPWYLHGSKFVRACAHLATRVRRLHRGITTDHLRFGGAFYGVSPAKKYMRALEAELRDCRDMPIREALATEPAAAFMKLWHHDTKDYQHAN